MRRLVLALALAACSLPAVTHAARFKTIMNEWLGAPRAEFVAAWGYPATANDVVEIGDSVAVYTYRSGGGGHRPKYCVLSVTFENDILTRWDVDGGNCTKYRREKVSDP
jgi:hypothetical protein